MQGHGAFGKVYRATHKRSGKQFALKRISKKQVKSQNMISQLNNQIQISKSLVHENIIKLYDTFQEADDIYLVLELAQNGQLYSRLVREGKFNEQTVRQMVLELLQAVNYLHSRDPPIIHRDIKPQNILLAHNNKIKLADFGWSNFLNKPRKTYCGTFDYLAPQMLDKSGHDQKLDIWCLGVLTYELLTGKTPFVVKNGKEPDAKKQVQQNILSVNINFPSDFPALAKSFVLGMVKRKPEERLTMKQIMNHEWLKAGKMAQEQQSLIPFSKPTLIDPQQKNIIESLNKKIRQLQQEVNGLKINEKMNATEQKSPSSPEEHSAMAKQIRKLKGIEQKNLQIAKDNDKLQSELNSKEKQIIVLKGKLQSYEATIESIEKYKADKKALQERVKKLQRQLEASQSKNKELREQLSNANDTVTVKIKRGQNITMSQANSQEFIEYLEKTIQELSEQFAQSKKTLLKVLEKTKMNDEKEEELVRLRIQQANMRDQIRSELKEEFQLQKDQILLSARNELMEQRQKWFTQRSQLKILFEESSNASLDGSSTKASSKMDDLELQLKTLRELNQYYERKIGEQNYRIKDLEEELKRKK